ncbi:hypothetical protein D3C72_1346530 [compost metagenome]
MCLDGRSTQPVQCQPPLAQQQPAPQQADQHLGRSQEHEAAQQCLDDFRRGVDVTQHQPGQRARQHQQHRDTHHLTPEQTGAPFLETLPQVPEGNPRQPHRQHQQAQPTPGTDGRIVVAEECHAAQQLDRHNQPGGSQNHLAHVSHAFPMPAKVRQRQPAGAEQYMEQGDQKDEIAQLLQRLAQRLQRRRRTSRLQQHTQRGSGKTPGQRVQQAPAQRDQGQSEMILREIVYPQRNGLQLPQRIAAKAQQRQHTRKDAGVHPEIAENACAQHACRIPRRRASRLVHACVCCPPQHGAPFPQPGTVHGLVAREPQ